MKQILFFLTCALLTIGGLTEVEAKEDTQEPVATDSLEYASAIKNLVKKVKQIN